MKKDMKEWFAEQDFNTESLPSGHRNRFLDKRDAICDMEELKDKIVPLVPVNFNQTTEDKKVITLTPWFKWSLAVGLAVLIGFSGLNLVTPSPADSGLSSVSPQMAQAEDFFTNTIRQELEKLNKEQSPDTERIIADTKMALNKLEAGYTSIKADFKINNDSKTVIAAMIQNFQNRIDLLELALEQIEHLKNFKEQENEHII
jgi:hypothetical protein